ncbi:hypothetical protein FRB98_003380 [Tulasnella sp. 332]|nr:hypothetical protein FRB98_003380 [Tulasnella sp. 332]
MDLLSISHALVATHSEPSSHTAALVTTAFTHEVLNVIATSHIQSVAIEVAAAEVFSARPSDWSASPDITGTKVSALNCAEAHDILSRECLKHLNGLERDICQLQSSRNRHPDPDEMDEHTRLHILSSQKNACLRWAHHLSRTRTDDKEAYNLLRTFLTQRLLHWLEVMSLLRKVDVAVGLLEIAASWIEDRQARLKLPEHELLDLVRDSIRFIQAFKSPISALADGAGNLPGATICWSKYLVRFLGVRVPDLSERLSNSAGSPRDSTSGYYSDVCSMRPEPNGPIFAIKALRPVGININSPAGLNRFFKRLLREVKLGSSLQHPHVIQVSGFAIVAGKPSLVTLWCKYGNIRQYLQKRKPNYDRRLALLRQVAEGLKYLHLHDPVVAHGDLKADNVLIGDEEQAQLCDYGLSRFPEDSQLSAFFTSTIGKGTTRWCAPELLADETTLCSTMTDIYSFASLGLEIMTDQIPFVNLGNGYTLISAIVLGQTPAPQLYPELPARAELWDLFRRCWSLAPKERPTISTVCDELDRLTRQKAPGSRIIQDH